MAQLTSRKPPAGFSRRDFLRGSGAVAAAAAAAQQATAIAQEVKTAAVPISGEQTITLDVNGKTVKVKVEPRTTLLEVLRYPARPDRGQADLHRRLERRGDGARRRQADAGQHDAGPAGGRQEDPDGREPGRATPCPPPSSPTTPSSAAFARRASSSAVRAFLNKNPKATEEEIRTGLNGNLCRCGTYANIIHAALDGRERRRQWLSTPGPTKDKATAIGKRVKRLDGPAKATGAAKYTYDINLEEPAHRQGPGLPARPLQDQVDRRGPGPESARRRPRRAAEEERRRDRVAGRSARRRRRRKPKAPRPKGVTAIKVEYELLHVVRRRRRPRRREAAGMRTSNGGGKTQLDKEPGDNDDEADVRRQGNRAAAQGIGPHGRRRLRHRRHHALLPGAARLDRASGTAAS